MHNDSAGDYHGLDDATGRQHVKFGRPFLALATTFFHPLAFFFITIKDNGIRG
jgi:hypothetical protein